MPLADDSHGATEFSVHQHGLRLETHDVVGALIADELVGGDVHELDVLRHDDVRGHLVIDENGGLAEIALEDALIIRRELVDVTDADSVALGIGFLDASRAALRMDGQEGKDRQSEKDKFLLHVSCTFRVVDFLKHLASLSTGEGPGVRLLLLLCVDEINNSVVLDARLVLADVVRHGGAGTLIHVL